MPFPSTTSKMLVMLMLAVKSASLVPCPSEVPATAQRRFGLVGYNMVSTSVEAQVRKLTYPGHTRVPIVESGELVDKVDKSGNLTL